MTTLPTKEQLADKFAAVLREWLEPHEFERMKRLNRAEPRTPHKVCHSHDFCDANMAMHEAFTSFGIDPLSSDEAGEGMSEQVNDLWNDSWDHAFKEHLS